MQSKRENLTTKNQKPEAHIAMQNECLERLEGGSLGEIQSGDLASSY
ncbi:hypothetical protein [Prochlorococcus sp. MIT 0603]|nr:hypothetical protein [Prochlorococcus sp. MIT 0603]KGG16384.1 hypothetical protein EV07_1554 [Prochlorococcus sp. MIT 0603]KGG17882.1 hypothetical protein EV06_0004 [Prochlorococcus sp. MIT 0602]